MVVADEEAGPLVVRVGAALLVGGLVHHDVLGLALDDDEDAVVRLFVGDRAPDDDVGAGMAGAALTGHLLLLGHLVERIAVFVDQGADVILAHALLGCLDQVNAAQGAVDATFGVVFDLEEGGDGLGGNGGGGALGHGGQSK